MKTPDRNDLELGTVVLLIAMSVCRSLLILSSRDQPPGTLGPLACVFLDCRRTRDKEPLSFPIFILADDVVRLLRFASRERADSF